MLILISRPLLDNVGLRLALVHLPVGLHVLELQSEGGYVLLAFQEEDPPALVQACRLTDPHGAFLVAHT